jgi:hypothetical protein
MDGEEQAVLACRRSRSYERRKEALAEIARAQRQMRLDS